MTSKSRAFAIWAAEMEDNVTVGAGASKPTHVARLRAARALKAAKPPELKPAASMPPPDTLTFDVPKDAKKDEIRAAVETLFAVKVDSVRIVNARVVKAPRAIGRKKAHVKLVGNEKGIADLLGAASSSRRSLARS